MNKKWFQVVSGVALVLALSGCGGGGGGGNNDGGSGGDGDSNAKKYDGDWKGTTSQGQPIGFRVVDNTITSMTVGFKIQAATVTGYNNKNNSCTTEVSITIIKSEPINGNQFSLSGETGATSYIINGTFNADTTISGNMQFTYSNPPCSGSASATWQATKVNNTVPVANAGSDQSVKTGAVVTLDGNGSSDANGDTLAYLWSLESKPDGSNAFLSDFTTAKPTFTADVAGTYVAKLVVNDGIVDSAPDDVTITATTAAANAAPVANAGPDQNVSTGAVVTLDGSGSSDADGNTLTYQWSFVSKPAGSAAVLADPTTAKPSFTADVDGIYVVSLVVNDGIVNSVVDEVTITATTAQFTLPITTDNAVDINNQALDTYDYLESHLWYVLSSLREFLLPSEDNLSNATIASKSLKKIPAHSKRSPVSVHPSSTVKALATTPTCFNEGGTVTLNLSDTNGDGYMSQGESATYEFQNCQFGGWWTTSGEVTLQAVTLDGTNSEIKYTFTNFIVKEEDDSTTLDGDLTQIIKDQSPYYEEMKGGSLVIKETDGATTNLSNYLATYLENESSYSRALDADKMDSATLGGSVGIKTSELFNVLWKNEYPSKGSLTITGANNSTVSLTAENDAVHVNLAVDANGDGAVDQNFRMTWSALEEECPIGTQNSPPVISDSVQFSTNYSYDDLGRLIGATTTVTISASDPEGNPLTYSWSASNGSISGNTATATWQRIILSGQVAPGVVTVTVSDGQCGGTTTKEHFFQ